MLFESPSSLGSDALKKDDIARKIEKIKGLARGPSAVIEDLNKWLERSKISLAQLQAKKGVLESSTGDSPEAKQSLRELFNQQEQDSLDEIARIEATIQEQTEAWGK